MTRRLSGPKWLELRYLLLTFCFLTISEAAPLQETTEITEYKGCYYNFNQYSQGDRITTNEPCLNCTCHNDMLMCYLRVCPFTKPIGEDCTVEKREDQCCPIITCPEVPVELIDHHHEGGSSTDLAHPHRFGCTIDSKYFREGAQVPSDPRKPCELCYCIRNTTFCVMQECTLHVVGCQPIYNKGVCCPVRYVCDHDYDEDLLLEDLTTTTEKPTPGYILTTTISPNAPSECNHHGETYFEGALVPSDHACQHCYCMRGHVVCAVQECLEPLENRGKHCVAKPVKEGKCCPDEYDCEPSIIETTTSQIGEDTERPYGDSVTSSVEEKLPIAIKSPTEEYVTEISESGTTQASITESHKEIELVDESENEIHVDEKPGVPVIHRDQDDVTTSHYIEEKTESNIKETVISAEDEALQQHIDDRLQDEIEPPQKPLSHEQQTEKILIGDKTEKPDIVETQTVTAEEIDRVTAKVDESIEDEGQEGSGEISQTDETTVRVFHDDQIEEEITESVQEFTTKTKPVESLITEREGATPTEQPSGITEISEISAQTKKPYLDVHEKPHEESEVMVEKPIEIKEKPEEEEEIKTESDELIISTTSSVKTEEEDAFIPQVIPGEGDCLSAGITYNNNTIVPPMSVCELKCICFNSVVQCDFVKCPPPPIDRLNCETSYEEKDSCCPIYKCVTEPGVTVTIASDEDQTTSATVESSEIPAIVEEIQTHEKIPTEVPAVVEETKLDEEVPAYVEEISITDDEDKLKEATTQKDIGYTEKEAGVEIEKIPSTATDSEIITETESELEEDIDATVTPHKDIIASTAHKVESAAEDEGELSERTTIKYDHDEDITQKQEEAPEKLLTSKAESSTSMSVEEDFISPTSTPSIEEIPLTTISGSEVSSRPTKISIPLLHDAEEGSGIIDEETSEHILLEQEQPGTTIKTPRPLNITDRLEKGDEGTDEPGVTISESTEKIDESTERGNEYDVEISGITTEYVKITKEEEKTTEGSELIGIDQVKPTEKLDEGKPEIEHDVEDKYTESSVKDQAIGISTISPTEDQHTEKPLEEISLEKIQEGEQTTEFAEITHESKPTIVYDKEELDKGTAEVTTEFSQDKQKVQTITIGEAASAVKEEDTLTETPDIDEKIRDEQEPTESTGIKQDKEETPIETTEIIEEGSGDITPSSHTTEIYQDEEKPSAITEKLEDTYTEKIPAMVIPSIEDTTDIAKPEVQDQVKPITEIEETELPEIEYKGELTTKSKEEEYKEEVTTKSTEEEKIRVEKLPVSTTDKELEEVKPTAFKESDEHKHDAYELPVVTEKTILIDSMKPVHDETSGSVETQDEGEKGTTEISKDKIDTYTEADVTEKLPTTTDQRKKDEEVHKPTEKEQEEKEKPFDVEDKLQEPIEPTTEKLLVEDYSTEKSGISEIIPTEAEPSVHIELDEEQLSETTEAVVEKSTETYELVKPIDEKPTKTDESTDVELATGKPTDIAITTERDVSVTIKSTESILGEHEDQEQIGAISSKPKEEHAYDTTESGEQLVEETPEGEKPKESTEIDQKEYDEQTLSITTETLEKGQDIKPIESVDSEEYDIQKPTETTDITQSDEYEEDKQSVTTESAEKEKLTETASVTTVSQKDEIEEQPAVFTDSPIKEHIEEGTESEEQQVLSTESPNKEHIDLGTETEEQQIITTESAEKEKIKEIVSQKDETYEQPALPTELPIKAHIEEGAESEEQVGSTESPIKEHIEEGTESEEHQVVSTDFPIKEHIEVGTESEEPQVVSTESPIKEHIEEGTESEGQQVGSTESPIKVHIEEGAESEEQQPLTTESAETEKLKETAPITTVSQKDEIEEQQIVSTDLPIKEHIEVGTESEEQQVVFTESPIKEHIEVGTESEEQQVVSTEIPIKEHIEVGTESEEQPLTTESTATGKVKETAPITTVSQKDEIEKQVVSTESPIKEHIEVGTESEEQQVVSTESPIKEHIEVGTESEEQVVSTESSIKEHIEVGTESEEQQVVSTESPIKEHIQVGTESEEQVVSTESSIKEHIEVGTESEEQQVVSTESPIKEHIQVGTESEEQVVSTESSIKEHIEVGTESEEQQVVSTESPIKEHIEVGIESEEQPLTTESTATGKVKETAPITTVSQKDEIEEPVVSTESPIKEHIEVGTESEEQQVVSTGLPIKEHIEVGTESEEQQVVSTESPIKEHIEVGTESEEQVVSTDSSIKEHIEVGTESEEQQVVSTESPIKEHIEVGAESEELQLLTTESAETEKLKETAPITTVSQKDEIEEQQIVSTDLPIKEHIEVGTESEVQQVVFTESPIKEHIEVGTESEEQQVVSTEIPIKEHIEVGIESEEQQPLTTESADTGKVKETAPITTVSQKDEIEEQQIVSTDSPIKEHVEEGTESEEQQVVSTESSIKEHIEEGTESEEQQVVSTESPIKEHIEEGAESEEQLPLTTESAETDKLKETAPITTASQKDEIEEQQVVSTDLPIKEHIEEEAESEEQQPLTTEAAEKEKIEEPAQITTVSQKDAIEEQIVSTESTIKEHVEEGTESEEQQPITTESTEKDKIKETVTVTTVSQKVETDEQQVVSTESPIKEHSEEGTESEEQQVVSTQSPIKEHIEEGAESEEQLPLTTESTETDKLKETTASQKDEIDEEQYVSTESSIKEEIEGEAESEKPIEHGTAPSTEKEHIPYEEDKLGVTISSGEANLEQTTVKEVPEAVTHIEKETKPLDSYNLIESGESTATAPSITTGHKVEEEVVVTEIPQILMDALDKKITKKPGEFTTDKVTVMPSALDDRISDEDSSATIKPDQIISPTESAEEMEKEKEETPIAVTTEKAITISPTVSHEDETTKAADESIEAQKPIDIVSDVQKPIESDEEIEKEQYPIQEAFTPKPATTPPTHSTHYGGDTGYGQMPYPSSSYPEEEYIEEEEVPYGPGTCRYGGKLYVSAQQIPREDPCDFCFCFRSDIICLQQSCPPPISRCHEEPIQGFCCPRYECPVSMGTVMNVTTSTTTTTTTLPPHFLPHAYKGAASKRGCHIQGVSYQVGETVKATSGPCLHCICGRDGQMQCDPKVCTPEPMMRQMIAVAASRRR